MDLNQKYLKGEQEMNIVGLNVYEFKEKDTEKTVHMYEIHCTDDSAVIEGIAVCKFNITGERLGSYYPKLGDEIIPIRNEKGRIQSVYQLAVSEPASYGNTQ